MPRPSSAAWRSTPPARKVTAAERCKAEILPAGGGRGPGVPPDRRLPAVARAAGGRLVFKVPGFTALDDLSRYELKVTGLAAARYDLAVDGQKVGTFSKEELAGRGEPDPAGRPDHRAGAEDVEGNHG